MTAEEKLKAIQERLDIHPGQRAEEQPEPEQDAPASCPDVAPYDVHTDTPGAARFRAAQDCVRAHQVTGEGKWRCFGREAIRRLAGDLLDALNGECRLTIRWTRNDLDEE